MINDVNENEHVAGPCVVPGNQGEAGACCSPNTGEAAPTKVKTRLHGDGDRLHNDGLDGLLIL